MNETEVCSRCSSPFRQIWTAPDAVWHRVTAPTTFRTTTVCPRCFDQMARLQGIELYWACAEGYYPDERPKIHTYPQLSMATGIPQARLERLRVFAPEAEEPR